MQKEMDAKYYDAVVKRNKQHAARWVEVGRRGNIVILGKVQDVKQQISSDSSGLAVPEVREGEQPGSDGVQSPSVDSGSPVSGNHPKRRGRRKKERVI